MGRTESISSVKKHYNESLQNLSKAKDLNHYLNITKV